MYCLCGRNRSISAESTYRESPVSLLFFYDISQLKIIVVVLVRQEFERVGLQSGEPYDFKPHLTIAKMSRDVKAAKKVKKFDPQWFAPFKDAYFGAQSYACELYCNSSRQYKHLLQRYRSVACRASATMATT